MGHSCPECGCACYCHGDIDDIVFDEYPEGGCDCCPDPLDDDDDDWYDDDPSEGV